ncbi:MAG: hypothetical protein L0271_03810, partial [Gemmatimonadetes bacterium]|nr:hypothetical protein [Gemmatimonadota bacterium]
AVAILRSISTRVGGLVEALTRERQSASTDNAELARLRSLIEHVARRIDLMEERLDFTERLIGRSRTSTLAAARAEALRESEVELLG